jgi:bifunctional non-homologous end joining protein LigD
MTLPTYFEAMRASEPENPLDILDNDDYVQEYKWDGSRTFAFIGGNKALLVGKSWVQEYAWFKQIYTELQSIGLEKETILDCELVWVLPNGKDYFLTVEAKDSTIQEKNLSPRLMVFDILKYNDENVKPLDLLSRKALIEKIIPSNLTYVKVVHYVDNTLDNYQKVIDNGGEGVVAKLKIAPYIADKKLSERLAYWIKIKKTKTEDCIVLGCSVGNGYRANNFGSLILGQYTTSGNLIFVGKEGKMNFELIDKMMSMMKARQTTYCPIDNYPDNDVLLWCDPSKDPIVVEMMYHKRTQNNVFRFPKFKRIRYDKLATDCIFWES